MLTSSGVFGSAGAEAGLLRACQRAGGPVSSRLQGFLGRGALQVRHVRLGVGHLAVMWRAGLTG